MADSGNKDEAFMMGEVTAHLKHQRDTLEKLVTNQEGMVRSMAEIKGDMKGIKKFEAEAENRFSRDYARLNNTDMKIQALENCIGVKREATKESRGYIGWIFGIASVLLAFLGFMWMVFLKPVPKFVDTNMLKTAIIEALQESKHGIPRGGR